TLSAIATLTLATTAPTVKAQTTAVNPTASGNASSYINQLQPFNLVYLAYQGYFEAQGIPSNSALIMAHQNGHLSAKTLVQSAVQANRLSPQVLTDKDYLNAVEVQLNGITNIH
ncbi:MAG: hypothetical protein ICV78_12185, partial [Tolypothrix sp. Co-bin9]|nr:hypothetical protein [Tolypothrix sp. Co-bin9]